MNLASADAVGDNDRPCSEFNQGVMKDEGVRSKSEANIGHQVSRRNQKEMVARRIVIDS